MSPRTAIQRGTGRDRYNKTAKIVRPTLVTRYSTTIAHVVIMQASVGRRMAWIEDRTAPSSWSGASSLAAVRFRAPDMVLIASPLSAGWPACLSLTGLFLCPSCVIINMVFHSNIEVGNDGDHDGSTAPDSGARRRRRDRTGRRW